MRPVYWLDRVLIALRDGTYSVDARFYAYLCDMLDDGED